MTSEEKQPRSGQSQKAETPADARQACAPAMNWFDAVWKLTAAAAVIAIAVVAWLQWKTLSAMENLLAATERPWLAAAVEPVQLVFDDKGGGLTLKMTIKNNGPVPAIDVLSSPVLLLDDKQPYKQACGHYGVGGGVGPALAKDETLPKTSTAWLPRQDFGHKISEPRRRLHKIPLRQQRADRRERLPLRHCAARAGPARSQYHRAEERHAQSAPIGAHAGGKLSRLKIAPLDANPGAPWRNAGTRRTIAVFLRGGRFHLSRNFIFAATAASPIRLALAMMPL